MADFFRVSGSALRPVVLSTSISSGEDAAGKVIFSKEKAKIRSGDKMGTSIN